MLTNKESLLLGALIFVLTGLFISLIITPFTLLKGYSVLDIFRFSFGFSAVTTTIVGIYQTFFSKDTERYIQKEKEKQEDKKEKEREMLEKEREKEKQVELTKLKRVLDAVYSHATDGVLLDYIKKTKDLSQRIEDMRKNGVFSVEEEHHWNTTVPRDLAKLFVLFDRMDEKNQKETKETMKQIITNKQTELEMIYQRYQNQIKQDWDTVVVLTESREI